MLMPIAMAMAMALALEGNPAAVAKTLAVNAVAVVLAVGW